jgi:hypothetical protein
MPAIGAGLKDPLVHDASLMRPADRRARHLMVNSTVHAFVARLIAVILDAQIAPPLPFAVLFHGLGAPETYAV